jgi:hypothetical protein
VIIARKKTTHHPQKTTLHIRCKLACRVFACVRPFFEKHAWKQDVVWRVGWKKFIAFASFFVLVLKANTRQKKESYM